MRVSWGWNPKSKALVGMGYIAAHHITAVSLDPSASFQGEKSAFNRHMLASNDYG